MWHSRPVFTPSATVVLFVTSCIAWPFYVGTWQYLGNTLKQKKNEKLVDTYMAQSSRI